MSSATRGEEREERFGSPPEDPVGFHADKAAEPDVRGLAIRFAFGAATSAVAGLIALLADASWSGPMLAFPAILAASVTLISNEETRKRAREDARGAVLGALALAVFAAVVALLVTRIAPGLALAVAAVAWLVLATGLYWVVWARRRER
jgi:uncharacterized protein DUF3147